MAQPARTTRCLSVHARRTPPSAFQHPPTRQSPGCSDRRASRNGHQPARVEQPLSAQAPNTALRTRATPSQKRARFAASFAECSVSRAGAVCTTSGFIWQLLGTYTTTTGTVLIDFYMCVAETWTHYMLRLGLGTMF